MINPNFHLKDPQAKQPTLIYLNVTFHKTRLKVSTQQKVIPRFWNSKKQRVSASMAVPDYDLINQELDTYAQASREAIRKLGVFNPSAKELKREIQNRIERPHLVKGAKSFWDYFEEFVDYQKIEIQKRTVIDYDRSLRKHLRALEENKGVRLRLDSFSISKEYTVCDEWNYYLRYEALNAQGENGLSLNYAGKLNKCLRTFLNWCFERKYAAYYPLKQLPVYTEDTPAVYLTEEEIAILETLPISDPEQRLARNLFLIGCETGLRFSDFNRIHSAMILNGKEKKRIKGYQKKTKTPYQIPLSRRAESILQQYNYNPPSFGTISHFNKLLRKTCQEAGFNQTTYQLRQHGKTQKEKGYEKWELVSSHTARRSFCTNKYFKGMQVQTIMKFSGHKSERAFMRYLKMDDTIAAETSEAFF